MSEPNTDVHNALIAFGGMPLRYRTFGPAAAHLEMVRAGAKTPSPARAAIAAPVVRRTAAAVPAPVALPPGATKPLSDAARSTTHALADIFRILASDLHRDEVAAR